MDERTAASTEEVVAVEPVIRRVVSARAANSSDVDDLVQDCLERLLAARGRLAPDAVLPYAVVVARNLVSSHARIASRHAAAAPRIYEAAEPERPDEMLLQGEARDALLTALAQLSDQERENILAYYAGGPAGAAQRSPGALRVQMARTRAKLRLEYLLAFRRLELPTPVCRGVLLAISAGDTRRQRELHAGQHLLECAACAALAEPLDRRSLALTAVAVPGGLLAWAAGTARAHPVQATVTAAGAAAAVAAGIALAPGPAPRPAPAPAADPVAVSVPASPSAPVIRDLSVDGRALPDADTEHSLKSLIGRTTKASGVTVVAAVTRNGFWVGSAHGKVWVQLTGPLRALSIRAGDRVWFTGTWIGNPADAATPASTHTADAALLARQGAHLVVKTISISVGHPGSAP